MDTCFVMAVCGVVGELWWWRSWRLFGLQMIRVDSPVLLKQLTSAQPD